MHYFWDAIIEPILESVKPETVVEIGSEYGTNTQNLLFFLRNDTKVHVVDPLPKYDVAAWQERYGERFVFHKASSLEALPLIDRFDVVLIDGDHNWYTVYNELKLIEKRCAEIPQPFPLVMLHDVGWPYGRRDLYYDPETIPEAYRKPYEKKGMRPGLTGLAEEGGANAVFHNAVYENGPRNGVLTAIEDFLSETEQQLELIKVPGLYGLGIIVSSRLKEQSEKLVGFLANLDFSPVVARYIEQFEKIRLEILIELQDHMAELAARDATIRNLQSRLEEGAAEAERSAEDLRSRLEEGAAEAERSAEQMAGRDAAIQDLRDQLAAMQAQLDGVRREREALHSTLAALPADTQIRLKGILKREALRSALPALPAEATLIIVSEGDDELLELDGCKGWHFPQTEDGDYAGRYPADGTAAIAHLEALRAKGGDYLIFPGSALRWLEHHEMFRQHLESRYRVVVRHEDTCVVFALRQPVTSENAPWWTKFEEVIAEFQRRFDRDPAILNWNTGVELAPRFPQHAIFSAPTADDALPYLDQTIDIVAASSAEPAAAIEARRVAKAAVVTFNRGQASAEPNIMLGVDWQLDEEAVTLPTTSIIIPSYNGIEYTEPLLVTLRETLPPDFRGEIIVVDDASTDDTQDRLRALAKLDKRLRILRNRENSGFLVTCNNGAKAAEGEIIIFVNNDTLTLPGWLPPMLRTFRDHPDAGAVGGKLVYPDGTLQEAGGVVFADGSAANFGRGDWAVDAPLYNYVREVDYCSGAFLATRRSLFEEIGGLDTHFRPIYYEETDYCFKLREMGYRVYYQPESVIIHLEGATSGTDTSKGAKRYQVVNQAKFVERWKPKLKRQPPKPDQFDFETWCTLAVRGESEGVEDL
jgi:GT2 family glycosyltransferase